MIENKYKETESQINHSPEHDNAACQWHYAVFDARNGKVSDATVWVQPSIRYGKVDEADGDTHVNLNGENI